MPAASAVTFGRASYTTATTPSGTLTRVSWMPLSSVRCSCTRPSGSGSATSFSSAPAIASMRASSSIKRSSKLSCVPAARAASMSCALAVSTSTRFARSAVAMAASALLRTSALVCASGAAAAFAASAMARTSCSSEAVMNFPPIRKPPAHRGGRWAFRPARQAGGCARWPRASCRRQVPPRRRKTPCARARTDAPCRL